MPVYKLIEAHIFPSPEEAEQDGLLAIGGDLEPKRLIKAYASGIFPWYATGQPVLWWSPDPRMILYLAEFKRSKNLRRLINSNKFEFKFDTDFKSVIKNCSTVPRNNQDGTWITPEMMEAYSRLHQLGFCHSAETYQDGKLVGGLYGVSLGGVFFGESMFHLVTDASKVALWHLVERLIAWDFDFIDVQQETGHLKRLGARAVDRRKFLNLLETSLKKETKSGSWNDKTK